MKKVIEERRCEAYSSRPDGEEESHNSQVPKSNYWLVFITRSKRNVYGKYRHVNTICYFLNNLCCFWIFNTDVTIFIEHSKGLPCSFYLAYLLLGWTQMSWNDVFIFRRIGSVMVPIRATTPRLQTAPCQPRPMKTEKIWLLPHREKLLWNASPLRRRKSWTRWRLSTLR